MKKLAVIILALALAGCATGYKPDGNLGGYGETQVDENKFQVYYKGNAFTSRDDAGNYLLLRSAEVALANGFSYFAVVDQRLDEEVRAYDNPVTSETKATAKRSGDAVKVKSQTITTGGGVTVYRHPRFSNTVVGYKTRPPANQQTEGIQVLDARMVSANLRKRYDIKDQ